MDERKPTSKVGLAIIIAIWIAAIALTVWLVWPEQTTSG
jgi:hypothetical protein